MKKTRKVNMTKVENDMADIYNIAIILEQMCMNNMDVDELHSVIAFQSRLLCELTNKLEKELGI